MVQMVDDRPNTAGDTAASPPAAYRVLAERLRREVRDQSYCGGKRLPTEAELSAELGLSRQTVRRAFQELVAEGVVYRVPGRGTFACEDGAKYLRPSGSIEDLMTIAVDTELEVVAPPSVRVELEAAGRLGLETDRVVTVTFRRFHEGQPYCVTTAYLPVPLGRGLFDVAELAEPRVRQRMTVLSVVQSMAGTPIAGADQSITAMPAPVGLCVEIDVAPGEPVLRIDRVYFDANHRVLELAVNYFNPARYSYRFRMGSSRQ
jgi:GntR family transcriptional regulator